MEEENCRHSSLSFIEILHATVPFSILPHLNLIKSHNFIGEQTGLEMDGKVTYLRSNLVAKAE